MEVSAHGVSAPGPLYEIGGQRFTAASIGFAEAIASARATHQRPRCLCTPEGVEMYVARLAGPLGGYIVKRMPDTGCRHACDCPSFEPPADLSGLGQLLGTAITEDPATGQTSLRLGFPLTKLPCRSQMPPAGGESESVCTDGTKLSLRGLLHYLWDQAELTKWHPGFAGKRTWGTVRRQLLSASEDMFARGDSLRSRLYIPETFFLDQCDEITARRSAQWLHALSVPGRPQHLMLLIGEVKEIVPARYGFKVVVKHVPDQGFAIDQQLYRRLGRHFETELALWGASEHIRMVIIATFSVSGTGVPTIVELSLMPVTLHWLPIEDGFEERLIERLVAECRSFVKGLRYNLGKESTLANATLTDCDGSAPLLFVVKEDSASTQSHRPKLSSSIPVWLWYSSSEAMPPLPPRRIARFSPLDSHTPHTW
ncbi:MAG TPA: DUF1173 domain-containing protein [Hydrogenophaga sp.]|uniref:DUF1173 domain-containing protein n=1 Tax=Hydrogenophaga sp. TaxID=1904254 RepID=UPI002BAE1388|nr:DUF1173 domain-containing protein [Hydrogenophaga sp.]HMN94006.1 DUF1173 domain-containing protein [Hydrogenophaga sp.]HMP11372.1 DUF1173 domain-containing protein [Hydrogenophaga sp.]